MPKTMLIDAYHPEETRVALLQGGKVEDFDFEYASRKPLRGNIYLARVTRVEPSLQAAFVEYGGNRHGFLAFGEIHPDYYQIPVADREVLRKAEALEIELAQKLAELNQDDDDDGIDPDDDDELRGRSPDELDNQPVEPPAKASDEDASDDDTSADAKDGKADDYVGESDGEEGGDWHAADENLIEALGTEASETSDDDEDDADERRRNAEEEEEEEEKRVEDDTQALTADDDALRSDEDAASNDDARSGDEDDRADETQADASQDDDGAEAAEAGDAEETEARAPEEETEKKRQGPSEEELAARARQKEIDQLRSRYEEAKRDRNRLLRAYKIQEVIKRRQIMLVQVVKEERGNKGAALTTYLSLAGRYGVLMPNTARGGGISRKITSQSDRRRLKKAMSDLDIAPNMGLIIRTAGAKRSKTEIKRDYDYLSRLWSKIREKTLESVAPHLIYEEANLMKRAIRDLYDKDTEQVIVQGEDGYREAKDFMKMLMPSHAKHVQQHKSDMPLFQKHKVEEQLDGMYQPVVHLKSGGYIVIQQTEALVSIDVNSGKATKERNVEQTALKTNSEAAVEVARQCRLRDLAGLIVIDFIDMEENRNNRAVEKKLKDAMKTDRARTQIGSISTFGLLEMSRQRRRSGIVDGTTQACPVCEGAGHVRSHEMAALRILRACEGAAGAGKHGLVTVKTSTEVALYILNTKRAWLDRMEKLYGAKTNIIADSSKYGDQYEVAGSGAPNEAVSLKDTIGDDGPLSDFDAPELPGDNGVASAPAPSSSSTSEDDDGEGKPKRRRRRRRRKGSGEDRAEDQDQSTSEEENGEDNASDEQESEAEAETKSAESDNDNDEDGEGKPKRRRRRGRRGGRRNRRSASGEGDDQNGDDEDQSNGEDAGNGDSESDDRAAARAADGPDEKSEPVEEPKQQAETPQAEATQTEEPKAEEPAAEAQAEEPTAEADASTDAPSAEPEAETPPQPEAEEPQVAEEPEETAAAATEEPGPATRPDDAPEEPRRIGWWQRHFQKP